MAGCFDESAGYRDTHFHRATSAIANTMPITTERSSRAGFRGAVDPVPTCLARLFRAFFFLLLKGVSNHLQPKYRTNFIYPNRQSNWRRGNLCRELMREALVPKRTKN